ncbi:hypothetical protein [Lactiplantibacillus fabifermentans]|uniref:AMP-dependent synthetase/ligase domain-containing protein n=2 Tax=Lactiplantibacillus fabifermentans TaxID=483011 RepID=A0A0R2NX83_9LACO|nr:hypothetical protein [Lactiplantibacillus fabifermentans]ETY75494.1 hypothetical protein LFAB_01395 [Lactiplantibacillus fabifermentans T30PCM01]KRO27562.1 hypothetical protein DY78_GL003122 [Lactiplantibacillus fabifermentans DSM 21115]
MSDLTDQVTVQLRKNYTQPLMKNNAQGIWYTGADLLEDLALCRTSLQQQTVGTGQNILISLNNATAIPVLLLASWQLGLTVTLLPPTSDLPTLAPQAYAAMVYPPNQTQRLAPNVDPQQISLLTLLLNTAPDFAYFVHDRAPQPATMPPADLLLPASNLATSQAELLAAIQDPTHATTVTDIYDLDTGIVPLLANLITPTPFSLASAG